MTASPVDPSPERSWPSWTRSPRSWLFAAQLVVVTVGAGVYFRSGPQFDPAFGVGLAGLVLLGLWLGLGTLVFPARLAACLALTVAGALAFPARDDPGFPLASAAMAFACVALFALVFGLFRRLLGLRVDFDPAGHAPDPTRGRLRIVDLLFAVTVAALVASAARHLARTAAWEEFWNWELVHAYALTAGLQFAFVAPPALALLAPRRVGGWLALAVLVLIVEAVLAEALLGPMRSAWDTVAAGLRFALVNVVIARALGARLFRIPRE